MLVTSSVMPTLENTISLLVLILRDKDSAILFALFQESQRNTNVFSRTFCLGKYLVVSGVNKQLQVRLTMVFCL